MKKANFCYKNSVKNDLVANILIILISVLLVFLSSRFLTNQKTLQIIVYAIAIAFCYSRIAIETFENLIAKKFSSDIISSFAIIVMFAAQKFYAAALIAVFYSISDYIFDLINADFSDKLTESDEYKLKYNVFNNNGNCIKYAEDLAENDVVEVNKGEYLSFSYITEESKKINKSGIFNGEDGSKVTVLKNNAYEIDFKKSKEDNECRSKSENIINKCSFLYSIVISAFGLGYAIYNVATGNGIFNALYFFAVFLVIANPFSLTSGISTANAFNLIRLKRNGVILENSLEVEKMANIQKLYINKQGVITNGEYRACDVFTADGFVEQQVLKIAASVEKGLESKIARAFDGVAVAEAAQEQNHMKSKGVSAVLGEKKILLGSRLLMDENNVDVSMLPETSLYLSVDNVAAGAIKLSDILPKENAKAVKIASIYGIETVLLSGDCDKNVQKCAKLCNFTKYKALCDEQAKEDTVNSEKNPKTVGYLGENENINAGFTAETNLSSDNNKNKIISLGEFTKRIKSAKNIKIFMYIRMAFGILTGLVNGFVAISPKIYNYFHNIIVETQYESGVKNVLNNLTRFLVYETHMSPWLIVIAQLVIINVFMVIALSFLNDDKKLRY